MTASEQRAQLIILAEGNEENYKAALTQLMNDRGGLESRRFARLQVGKAYRQRELAKRALIQHELLSQYGSEDPAFATATG